MMGNPSEAANGGGMGVHSPNSHKATFSGMTALIGCVAFLADVISLAVPHWGYYGPNVGPYVGYVQQGKIFLACLRKYFNEKQA